MSKRQSATSGGQRVEDKSRGHRAKNRGKMTKVIGQRFESTKQKTEDIASAQGRAWRAKGRE